MPATKYTYSISQDFPGGQVNFDNLHTEITSWSAGISGPELLRIDSEDDVIDLWFSDSLTPGELLELDGGTTAPAGGLIAEHDNVVTKKGESVVFDENGLVPRGDLPVLIGATELVNGEPGVVPTPQAGDDTKFLRGDGSWRRAEVPAFEFSVGGPLDVPEFPATGLASSIAPSATQFAHIRARRGAQGSSGTTTIQFELNGTPVSGAMVSWASDDIDWSEKSASFGPQAVLSGDRLSIRILASESGAEDVVGVVT